MHDKDVFIARFVTNIVNDNTVWGGFVSILVNNMYVITQIRITIHEEKSTFSCQMRN